MKITNDVYMIDGTEKGHIFLIKGKENIIIDTGFPGGLENIINEIEKTGVNTKEIEHILLTHHDVDHVGNAKDLKDKTGAKLWVSKEDAPYVLGEKKRPGLKKVIQTIAKYKIPKVDNYYFEDELSQNIKVIKAPGHTPGHVMFLYEDILFVGDLFRVKERELKEMIGFMNWSQEEYKNSLNMVKDIDFNWICPSHGDPIKRSEVENSSIVIDKN